MADIKEISVGGTVYDIKDATARSGLAGKQDTLVSGTSIKTINNESLLGSGNISISSGTTTDVQIGGTSITSSGVANIVTESTYNASTNKIATIADIPVATYDSTNERITL